MPMNVVDENDNDGGEVCDLLQAARRGDEQALGCLLAPHWHDLKLFCGLMLGNADAADRAIAQTVLRARSELAVIDSPATVRMWIHRIAARVCVPAVDDGPIQNVQPPEPRERAPGTRSEGADDP
jgi:DNA-directed RNA polymerase specialized sigma24 family protein